MPKAKESEEQKHYGICMYYDTFVMGGDVWQARKYKVEKVDEVLNLDGLEVFVWKCPISSKWKVNEVTTGGLLGDGNSKKAALKKAISNIEETPDLKEQIKKIGPVKGKIEVPYEEAYERFSK